MTLPVIHKIFHWLLRAFFYFYVIYNHVIICDRLTLGNSYKWKKKSFFLAKKNSRCNNNFRNDGCNFIWRICEEHDSLRNINHLASVQIRFFFVAFSLVYNFHLQSTTWHCFVIVFKKGHCLSNIFLFDKSKYIGYFIMPWYFIICWNFRYSYTIVSKKIVFLF